MQTASLPATRTQTRCRSTDLPVRAAGAAQAGQPGLARRLQGALQVSARRPERRAHERVARHDAAASPRSRETSSPRGCWIRSAPRCCSRTASPWARDSRRRAFRWVSYVDALMLPLSTKAEAATSPDREKLFPLEDKLLQRYLSDLEGREAPGHARRVSEDGGDAHARGAAKGRLRRREVRGRVPPLARLRRGPRGDGERDLCEVRRAAACRRMPTTRRFRTSSSATSRARPAGSAWPSTSIRSTGAGNFFVAAGADPLLLESVFNDPALRQTQLRHRPWRRCLRARTPARCCGSRTSTWTCR